MRLNIGVEAHLPLEVHEHAREGRVREYIEELLEDDDLAACLEVQV
jgi:hypothetical protein